MRRDVQSTACWGTFGEDVCLFGLAVCLFARRSRGAFQLFSRQIIKKKTHYNVYLSSKLGEIRGQTQRQGPVTHIDTQPRLCLASHCPECAWQAG